MNTKEVSKAPCENQAELVTYLYDEGSQLQRQSFERHLEACSACRDELNGFVRVREALGSWDLGLNLGVPRIEIAVRRNSIETLRDLAGSFSAWPAWLRLAGATATAALALLFVLALAGTRVDLRQGTISFGLTSAPDRERIEIVKTGREGVERGGTEAVRLTRMEIETMISERVAAVNAEDRRREEELRAQIASLSARLATAGHSQSRLAAALATLRTEQRVLAAKGQSTLGEWLFAANESREPLGGNNEKDN